MSQIGGMIMTGTNLTSSLRQFLTMENLYIEEIQISPPIWADIENTDREESHQSERTRIEILNVGVPDWL